MPDEMSPAARALKSRYERQVKVLTARPSFGQATSQVVIRVDGDGVECDVTLEDRQLRIDGPAADGGAAEHAHPGQLMRASVAACLAQGYRMWAVRWGVPLGVIEVTLTVSYDMRGPLGLGPEVPPGWQSLHIAVRLESDAPLADLQRLVAHTDRLSPMIANLDRAITREHTLTVTPMGSLTAHMTSRRQDDGRSGVPQSATVRLGPGGQQLRRWLGAAARSARPLVPGTGRPWAGPDRH
jgi:putative redox protein